jgi:hypothetical protein
MSLKTFHLVFVTAAIALAVGCAIWGLRDYWSPGGVGSDLVFGLGSIAVAIGLIVYERFFVKKLKQVRGL